MTRETMPTRRPSIFREVDWEGHARPTGRGHKLSLVVRPIRFEGEVAYVTITKGYEAVIDADDAHLVARWNWQAKVERHTVYAVRSERAGGTKRNVRMHRVILAADAGFDTDHADRDGLNNRRSNLRQATRSENLCNRVLTAKSNSGLKGVSWHRQKAKWVARITVARRQIFLGYFDDPQAAHNAYKAASVRLHGEFGRAAA